MKQHAEKCASKIGNLLPTGNTVYGECDCDSYHTFGELYDHRITLYIALCHELNNNSGYGYVWRSKKHSDGELCFGTGTQFILGIDKRGGKQITYHVPIERWTDTEGIETLDKAPEWDNHTSDDVLERLKRF
jgi:hypothetical protein